MLKDVVLFCVILVVSSLKKELHFPARYLFFHDNNELADPHSHHKRIHQYCFSDTQNIGFDQ
ncbi:hypothetical protein THOB06_10109 [Vibrio rotiferianus]|nr:hypothetical protein THOG10_10109 [Vibrio rotiferianus]CAH1555390.1 hypothetical protein THOB06_10109 [Vibrio rotiferianus]